MRHFVTLVGTLLVATVACTTQDTSGTERVDAESNALGIQVIEIQHTVSAGDKVTTVRGLGAGDEELALATLRVGMVLYTPEPELIDEAPILGTDLRIAVGATTLARVIPGVEQQEDALPRQPAIASFVRLSAVATEIQHQAGVRFATPATKGEVAFSAGNCDASRFPSNVAAALQCCQDGSQTWHKIGASGANYQKLSVRTYSTPCRTNLGQTGCNNVSPTMCAFGPSGARNDGVSGSLAVVFHPDYPNDGICGYDDGNGNYYPESYYGQFDYNRLQGTSPYDGCYLNGNPYVIGSEPIPDGERCTTASECSSGYCYPGPEAGSKYCINASMNCVRPVTGGVLWGAQYSWRGVTYTCTNPTGLTH